jgi:hypothetical protein
MQQTLEMQIPAQVTWPTRNSWSCLEHTYILRVGKIKCDNNRRVRKKGRGLLDCETAHSVLYPLRPNAC